MERDVVISQVVSYNCSLSTECGLCHLAYSRHIASSVAVSSE